MNRIESDVYACKTFEFEICLTKAKLHVKIKKLERRPENSTEARGSSIATEIIRIVLNKATTSMRASRNGATLLELMQSKTFAKNYIF